MNVSLRQWPAPKAAESAAPSHDSFAEFIEHADFPCVGAKSALNQGGVHIVRAQTLQSDCDNVAMHQAIVEFAQAHGNAQKGFRSLAIIFADPIQFSEEDYERLLWRRLQSWTNLDVSRGYDSAADVSDNPSDPHFALSFGGHAFFAIGMHPGAARRARRFSRPTIVLNLHGQFERLREEGKYELLRENILQRDENLQGNINPMLARFGTSSEARQYSGREVGAAWSCPFHRSEATSTEDISG